MISIKDRNEHDSFHTGISKATITAKSALLIQQQLKSFVPHIITVVPEAKELSSIQFQGYFLLADISGFTKLSSQLCAQGSKGLDKLRSITNSSFRSFIDIILVHGGDVIAFAGDALICIFRPPFKEGLKVTKSPSNRGQRDDQEKLHTQQEDHQEGKEEFKDTVADTDKDKDKSLNVLNVDNIAHCGLAAIACAKDICATKLNGVQIHCGITYGPMSAAILGGFKKKYAVILNGKCTEEIGKTLSSDVVMPSPCGVCCFCHSLLFIVILFYLLTFIDMLSMLLSVNHLYNNRSSTGLCSSK